MLKGLPLAYNKDFQEDKEALFDTVVTVRNSLQAMSILLEEGLEFSLDRLGSAVESDFSNATDVADYLVSKEVPFREAYQIVGRLVKLCMKEGILLKDLSFDQWQDMHPAFDQDIYKRLTPEHVVASRISQGGTGFAQVSAQLENWQNQFSSLKE